MRILNKLTIRNLKLNKKRTIATIIGIMLASSLITGIATLVSSFKATLIQYEKKTSGNYHYQFIDIPISELHSLENNENIENMFITKNIGYTNLAGKYNSQYNLYVKPYGYIIGFSDDAMANLNIKTIEGRLPQNENEIIIQTKMKSIGEIDWKIGDEITLDIGKRLRNGIELNQNNQYNVVTDEEDAKEEIITEITKTYKVVGIIESVGMDLEPPISPGYTMITYIDSANYNDSKVNVYVRYNQLNNIQETSKYRYNVNSTLVKLESGNLGEETMTLVYGIAVIIIFLIIITFVYCIRNSFNISITEKIKQYGMLSSIGATSKQIKYNVFFEGFILGIIAIPLGIILGISSIYIILKVLSMLFGDKLLGTEFIFLINKTSIFLAIILNSLTIYLSSRKSAKKASKISPIEAIRSNRDIKINYKNLKSPKFIKRIFGIGGEIAYKNLKRNKKKYRTIMISIIISVSLLIAMSSFVQNALKTIDINYQSDYNIMIQTKAFNYDALQEIAKNENVKMYSLPRYNNFETNEIKITFDDGTIIYENFDLCSVGQLAYNQFINELGLKYEEVKDKIIWLSIEKEKDITHIESKKYKKGDSIKGKINGKEVELEIAEISYYGPIGRSRNYSEYAIVSDDFWQKYNLKEEGNNNSIYMWIDAQDAYEMEEYISKNYSPIDFYVYNDAENTRNQKALWILISAFLYTLIIVFSLIGITNIFNTITTNINLRQKEFANLKSIGMTSKEFDRMINLESLFYGIKSLSIGVPIGIGLSYAIYRIFSLNKEIEYIFPTITVIIAIMAVLIFISTIMKFSLKKINKQNIIETIKNDNI